jgi:lauroyl/myristoyl acyltransferase
LAATTLEVGRHGGFFRAPRPVGSGLGDMMPAWRCRLESQCRLKWRYIRRRRNRCVDGKIHVGKVLNPVVVQGVHVATYDLLQCLIHSFGLAIRLGMVARRNIKLGAISPK